MKSLIAALYILLCTSYANAAGTGFGINVVEIVSRATITFTGPITFTAPLTIQTTNFVTVQQSSAVFTEKIRVGLVDGTTIHSDGYIDLTDRTSDPSSPKRGMIYFDTTAQGGAGALKLSLDGASFVPISTGSSSGGISSVSSNASQFSGDGTGGNPLTLLSSSVTLQGQDVVRKSVDSTITAVLTLNNSLVLNGVTDFGARTNIQIGQISCTTLPCRVHSSTDHDIYTATATATVGAWRNSRLGTGPLIP
jgi:hypothetical protein